MYHRLLKILIISKEDDLKNLLEKVSLPEQFSVQMTCRLDINDQDIKTCSIIIFDSFNNNPDFIKKIFALKNEEAVLVGCFSEHNLNILSEVYVFLDQVWIKPFAKEKVIGSFQKIFKRIKASEDAVLTEQYLDTLIDSLPDLIWFKDIKGAHLKVNNSFCNAVDKTKKQIVGRGHYYIWDIEPDEYSKGEYICLESEELVLNKKKTCLFDETVKCQDELRKFKTYKSPIFDIDGSVIGTVGFAHDVTDLHNLMIELNILLENLPFAVLVADKERSITVINQKFIDYFSLSKDDLIGQKIDSFIDVTKNFTRNKKWIIEHDEEGLLLLSKNRVLKVHNEDLLDVFGALAGYIYLFIDISIEHTYKNKLLTDANTDHLTKLNNRRSLQDFMRKTPCRRNTALLLADLDNFKEVNDNFGHDEGDKILVRFSNLLRQIFNPESLFRLGGDEFAVILPGVKKKDVPVLYAEKLIKEFENTIMNEFSHTKVSVSIGIALDVDDSENFGELFKRADIALYDAKNSGKSAYRFWEKV
jgi:diguanylate cyclase (GGDEF)-like protein/PAS domain S-box-containing protein